MKKIGIILAILVALSFSACRSVEHVPGGGLWPQAISDFMRTAPDDVLYGIGVANMASLSHSRTMAATRARAELARQMGVLVEDMVRDYVAGSEVDHRAVVAFQENITVQLARAELVGSTVVMEDRDHEGVWALVMMNRADVAREINQAQALARLAVPAMASFDAEARMNEAFDRHDSRQQVQIQR